MKIKRYSRRSTYLSHHYRIFVSHMRNQLGDEIDQTALENAIDVDCTTSCSFAQDGCDERQDRARLSGFRRHEGLRQDLDELWVALNDRRSCSDGNVPSIIRRKPGLLCLLFAILFSTLHLTANETLDSVLGQDRPKTLLTTTYLAAMISANLTGFPRRPTLYTLAAYVFACGACGLRLLLCAWTLDAIEPVFKGLGGYTSALCSRTLALS